MTKKISCVFVHGWSMNSAVWESVAAALPDWVEPVLVDLPGHGSMHAVHMGSVDQLADTLAAVATRPAIWVGWSLGGLAVLRLCERYPEKVKAALLVSTNPLFVSTDTWQHAVQLAVFRQFAADLEADQQKTIRRFLALQVKGQPDAVRLARQLQAAMDQRGQASKQALVAGLDILLHTDLRQALIHLRPGLHWALGARDTLVPVSVARALDVEYRQSSVTVYENSAHTPFLTEAEAFIDQLMSILQAHRD
jgi:pimeloyl-[acyl-carrier protein] methyl ester esterase